MIRMNAISSPTQDTQSRGRLARELERRGTLACAY